MADTTWIRVIAIAPELATVTTQARELMLEDAIAEITEDVWGDFEERAQRNLIAHWGTLYKQSTKNKRNQINN